MGQEIAIFLKIFYFFRKFSKKDTLQGTDFSILVQEKWPKTHLEKDFVNHGFF